MTRNVKAPLLAAFACALAIVPLAVVSYSYGPAETFDRHLMFDLHREVGFGYTFSAAFVNLGDLASLLIMLAAVCAIGFGFGRRREVLAAVVLVAGANVTTQVLKVVLEHTRSKAWEHGLSMPWSTSFPSGHTTAAASIAVALLLVVPAAYRLLAAGVGAALTASVGLAVVVLAWHYPSDVVGALLVVATWGLCAVAYLRQRRARDVAIRARRPERRQRLAVSTD
jgi:membrane-associated phospholipid phosphatase